jgi:hypothetical protein
MPALEGGAHLTVTSDLLSFSNIHATGGDVAVVGVYVARGRQRRAAFVVKKGLIAAGIDLVDDGRPGVRFFGLDDWYRDEALQASQLARAAPSESRLER